MPEKLDISVLFVEDDQIVRDEISYYLESKVREVIASRNGKEGLEKFLERKPDLVITDLKMPVMNGIELIENIRHSGYDVPVIVLTAFDDSDSREATSLLKVSDYIVKNFITARFWEVIHQSLKCHQKSRRKNERGSEYE